MYKLIYPGSREEPAEYASTNPGECYVCGADVDLDDVTVLPVDSPLGMLQVCSACWIPQGPSRARVPAVLCHCCGDQVLVRKSFCGAWETIAGAVARGGKLYLENCPSREDAHV